MKRWIKCFLNLHEFDPVPINWMNRCIHCQALYWAKQFDLPPRLPANEVKPISNKDNGKKYQHIKDWPT